MSTLSRLYDRDTLGRILKCVNPWCEQPVKVQVEHCATCEGQQARIREGLRRQREQVR